MKTMQSARKRVQAKPIGIGFSSDWLEYNPLIGLNVSKPLVTRRKFE